MFFENISKCLIKIYVIKAQLGIKFIKSWFIL